MSGYLYIAFVFAGLVPSIIILIGCCIIFGKMRNEDAVLMLVGKALGLLASIVGATMSLVWRTGMIDPNILGKIAFALPFVGLPASFLFAFGFIRIARAIKVGE